MSTTIDRLLALQYLLGAQFDRALARDDWEVMEANRVRARAVTARIVEIMYQSPSLRGA